MRIAITGGTGFIGRHLAAALASKGHHVVLVARGVDRRDEAVRRLPGVTFLAAPVGDTAALREGFAGCTAVAHCAGINRERGDQTYARVHVQGTEQVLQAARAAGVQRIAMVSFLRARPNCGSAYHESKWAAEELVRHSGLAYTVIKEGITYGRGDHMLTHLSKTLQALPLFATVGVREAPLRPVAVEDTVRVLDSAVTSDRLEGGTLAVVGPEALPLSEVVRRVARAIGRRVVTFPLPVAAHRLLAWLQERLLDEPLVALAQVRMLAEGMAEPLPAADPPPDDLRPTIRLTTDQIIRGLPDHRSASR